MITHLEDRLLTSELVAKRYGRSTMALWRWRHSPTLNFPQPVKIGRIPYWRLSEIVAWEQKRQAAA